LVVPLPVVPLPVVAAGLAVTGLVELIDALEFEEPLHPAANAARPHRARTGLTRLRVRIAAAYLGSGVCT
jgi:hypothetical protein